MPKLRTLINLALLIVGLAFINSFWDDASARVQSMEQSVQNLQKAR